MKKLEAILAMPTEEDHTQLCDEAFQKAQQLFISTCNECIENNQTAEIVKMLDDIRANLKEVLRKQYSTEKVTIQPSTLKWIEDAANVIETEHSSKDTKRILQKITLRFAAVITQAEEIATHKKQSDDDLVLNMLNDESNADLDVLAEKREPPTSGEIQQMTEPKEDIPKD